MKIAQINLGAIEIPPKSWGAIEKVIWNYKLQLEKLGHTVDVVFPWQLFDNNGLTMDETHVLSNHGIFYKGSNGEGEEKLPYGDIPSEISNVEILNCEFRNGGTKADVNDCGGDGILIINPSELSKNINIHNLIHFHLYIAHPYEIHINT